jgi:DNA polymerase III subunit gamma/tau
MSYVVLARKYRPRSFAEMVGQPHVVQALSNALERGRLHHAYLFTGTRGIGKTTISRILAKSLNCIGADGQGGITAHPCGVCPACTAVDIDRFPDYIEMDAASSGGKDEIRDLIERAAYKPSVGRFKVFMIDEAHQLSRDAFNALLKTLEEPPEYLKFVLATTDPEKMLPTVLSRCLQFNLRPMAPETVQAHLETVLNAEGVGFEAGALRVLGKAARGSMRDALSLADQAIAYGAGRVDEAVVRGMLGSVDRSQAAALLDALARRDAPALLDGIDGLRGRRPVGRRHARDDGGPAAAGGRGTGSAGCARRGRAGDPDGARAGRADAGRGHPAALQHRRARPPGAGADERRVRRADDGAAAPVRLPRRRRAGAGAAAGAASAAARRRTAGDGGENIATGAA